MALLLPTHPSGVFAVLLIAGTPACSTMHARPNRGASQRAPSAVSATAPPMAATTASAVSSDDAGAPKLLEIVGYGAGQLDPGGECVLYADGRVACWQSPSIYRSASPSFISDIQDATSIEGGDGTVSIVRRGGTVERRSRVYGGTNGVLRDNPVVQIAGQCMRLVDGTVRCECVSGYRLPLPGKTRATDLAKGGNHFCVATQDGDVTCWGQSLGNVLGDQVKPGVTSEEGWCPTSQGTLHFGDAVQVAASANSSCVRRRSGRIECWGEEGPRPKAIAVPPARSLRSGGGATCALTERGDAYCWGSFLAPPGLGEHKWGAHDTPVRLPLEHVTAIDDSVECAIIAGSRVSCWGIRVGCIAESDCFAVYDVPMPQ